MLSASAARALLVLLGLFLCLSGKRGTAATAPPSPVQGVVKRTLENGLRVLVVPRRTAPVVTTMLWYRVGSRDEVPGSTGIAHFLEHLMFKGTHKLKKGEVDRLTYQHGGSNNAFTYNDYTAYEFHFPKRHWKVALKIEADRMRNSVFDAQEFEAERQVVMEERRGSQDDPVQEFAEQLNAMSFVSHPYRNPVIGWMEDLRRLTREEVLAFYRKYYVPANATLVIAGDVTPEEAVAAARTAFDPVPALPAPVRPAVREPVQTAERRLNLRLKTQVSRFQMLLPCPTRPHADVYALDLLLYVLTEGKQSRLYRRLVETDQAAVDVEGGLGIYRDAGQLYLYATAKEGVPLARLESAVWEELTRMAHEPVTPTELERAKNQANSNWVHNLETAGDLANVIGEADALGGHQYLDGWMSRLRKVDAQAVMRAAATYLRRDRSTVGYLEPALDAKDQPSAASARRIGGRALRAGRSFGAGRPGFRTPRRRTPAPVSPAVTFPPLRPTEKLLPNGMRLILLENHTLPSVVFSARVNAGSFQEAPEQAGLATLTAAMLDEGTASRDHAQISAALEQVGAEFDATATRATTTATLRVLSDQAAPLLPLYAALLREPAFPADRLELVRSQLLTGLREEADDATRVARQAFNALVYGSHPAGRPQSGTEATVSAIPREALRDFHRRYYRPEHATLVVVGDFQTATLMRELEQAFGSWERGSERRPALPAVARQTDVRIRRVPMDKTQTQIVLGHLGVTRGNPDYLALRVMDSILGEGVGGGFTARIPYQLRDVQGLAYGVGSSITSTVAKEPGVFVASMGTEPAKEKVAVAALLKEIRRMRSALVTPAELQEAKSYLVDSYVFSFQTNSQLAEYVHSVQYYGLGYDYRRRFVAEIPRVTREDVLRVARKYLDPDHYSLAVVGPGQPKGEQP